MESVLSNATPAIQVVAAVISYLIDMFQKLGSLLSFATGITSID